MCHFVTATLPSSADVDGVRRAARAAKLDWAPLDNPIVLRQLEPGTKYFLTTRGHCDCRTVLGCMRYSREHRSGGPLDDVAKVKAKGWTSAKIERWLEERRKTSAKHERERQAEADARMHEAEEWLRFLRDVLGGGSSERLGLLLHDYRGSVDTDAVRFVRERIDLGGVKPEFLMRLKDDVLYEFENAETRASPR